MADKAHFRQAMKERLARMSENDRRVESQIIVRELKKIIEDTRPRSIGVYIPFRDEPNIRPLIEWLLEEKKEVSMPHVEGSTMTFVHVRSLLDQTTGPLGTPAPKEAEMVDECAIDLVLVPGRAFTPRGERMGRGNGGYDRWLSEQRKRNEKTRTLGICFDCQLVQEMPVEKHDEKVDAVLTATRKYVVRST
ncbi:MAG: 5-formyltetrahydrofolate cyclo-ligase [Candidatus Peribacteraceae bacterium]